MMYTNLNIKCFLLFVNLPISYIKIYIIYYNVYFRLPLYIKKQLSSMENQLKSNAISFHGLIFQGMGQLSPLFTFDGIISVAAFAQGGSPLAFLVGLIASLLTGNTLYQFSKRTASARGLYGIKIRLGYPCNLHTLFPMI